MKLLGSGGKRIGSGDAAPRRTVEGHVARGGDESLVGHLPVFRDGKFDGQFPFLHLRRLGNQLIPVFAVRPLKCAAGRGRNRRPGCLRISMAPNRRPRPGPGRSRRRRHPHRPGACAYELRHPRSLLDCRARAHSRRILVEDVLRTRGWLHLRGLIGVKLRPLRRLLGLLVDRRCLCGRACAAAARGPFIPGAPGGGVARIFRHSFAFTSGCRDVAVRSLSDSRSCSACRALHVWRQRQERHILVLLGLTGITTPWCETFFSIQGK